MEALELIEERLASQKSSWIIIKYTQRKSFLGVPNAASKRGYAHLIDFPTVGAEI